MVKPQADQLSLGLVPRRARPRDQAPVDRLLALLRRQGFDVDRHGKWHGSVLLRPCLGGTPIDWSVSTDVRGLPAQGLYEALCGRFCCGDRVFQSVRYSERQARREAA